MITILLRSTREDHPVQVWRKRLSIQMSGTFQSFLYPLSDLRRSTQQPDIFFGTKSLIFSIEIYDKILDLFVPQEKENNSFWRMRGYFSLGLRRQTFLEVPIQWNLVIQISSGGELLGENLYCKANFPTRNNVKRR